MGWFLYCKGVWYYSSGHPKKIHNFWNNLDSGVCEAGIVFSPRRYIREIWNSWGLQSINTHRKRAAIIGISHKGSPFENVGSNKIQKCETPRKKADQIFGKTAKASEKVHQKSPTCLMIFFSFFFWSPNLGHISGSALKKVVRLNPKVMGGERRGRAGEAQWLVEFQVGSCQCQAILSHTVWKKWCKG